jgi:hypothetical protein
VSSEYNDEDLEPARREIRALAATLNAGLRQPSAAPGAAETTIERSRLAYAIGELTDRHHRAFVDHAFEALLKRKPEPAEARFQLARLAAGTAKVEIVGDLAWSDEGRRTGVRVDGLRLRYLLAKATRIPVLGYLLELALGLAGLPAQARHQRAVETYFAAHGESARDAHGLLARDLAGLDARVGQERDAQHAKNSLLRQRIDDLHAYAHGLTVSKERLERALVDTSRTLRTRIEANENASRARFDELDALRARIDELEFLRRRVHAMNRWSDALGEAFAQIEDTARERSAADVAFATEAARAHVAHDGGRVVRDRAWTEAFADALPPNACALVLGDSDAWCELLRARGVTALADAASDGATTSHTLYRCPEAGLDGIALPAASILMRGSAGIHDLLQMHRALRSNGVLLLALAPDIDSIVGSLLGGPQGRDIGLLAAMLVAARFTHIARIDAADGTPALMARKAAA